MKTLRLFISSPGDVGREREATRRVIDRLQTELAEHIMLDPYFWEWEPVDFSHDYQSQIPSTADFDIVICLLWSKLGSRLGDQYKLPPDGKETASSGTQYELMQALHGKQQHPEKLPDLLVWVNKAPPPPASSPPLSRKDEDELIRQRRALQDFLATITRDTRTGIFTAAVNRYEVPSEDLGSYTYLDEFEDMMDKKLRKLIQKHIGQRTVKPKPQWQGSPFRDLDVFEFEHAPIFFGRSRAVGEVVRLLQSTLSKPERCHFALILGASGSGKSSLARAGVLPLLTRPGVIEGIGLWRCAIVRPSDDSADLFQALAAALLQADQDTEGKKISGKKIEPQSPSSIFLTTNLLTSTPRPPALPELADPESSSPQQTLADKLRSDPQSVALRVELTLTEAARAHEAAQRRALEDQITTLRQEGRLPDAERKQAALQQLTAPRARLVLLLDQMEELFTLNYAPDHLRAFLAALDVLARNSSGRVFVIGTLRSDFYPRYQEQSTLVDLARDGETYDLLPPTPDEISQIIRRPASLAALQFEPHPTTAEHTLADTLRDEALADTEALPLLEHVLNRLYQAQLPRADGSLTFADYEEICGIDVDPKTGVKTSRGVGGALGKHAEDIFTGQNRQPTDPPPPWTEDTFRAVFRCLVTFGKGEGDTDVPNRRAFTYQDLIQSDPAAQALVDTFIHERLLIADTDAQSRAIVRLAHEALLTRWPRLSQWLQTAPVRDLMSQRRRLESSLRQWQEQNRTPDCYLQPGFELEEGKQLLEKHEAALKPEEREFIEASVAYHKERERKATRWRRQVIGVLSALTCIALLAGVGAWNQAQRANVAATESNAAKLKADAQILEASQKAWGTALYHFERGDSRTGFAFLAEAVRYDSNLPKVLQTVALHRFAGEKVLRSILPPIPQIERRTIAKHVRHPQFEDDESGIQSSDGSLFLRGNGQLFEAATATPIGKPLELMGQLERFVLSPDGQSFVTVGKVLYRHPSIPGGLLVKGYVARIWDRGSNSIGVPIPFLQTEGGLDSIAYSSTGKYLLSKNDAAQVWDAGTGKPMCEPLRHGTERLSGAEFSPDGALVVTSGYDKTARIWEAATGKELAKPMLHERAVARAHFSPDGQRVVTASYDHTAKVWDAATGNVIGSPMQHEDELRDAFFSPDGLRVLTVCGQGTGDVHTLRLWDASRSMCVSEVIWDDQGLSDPAFSEDGAAIVTHSRREGTEVVWNSASGRPLGQRMGDNDVVGFLANLSPNGLLAIAPSHDNTARIWEASTGKPRCQPLIHRSRVNRAVFSPDSSRAVTVTADKSARLWDTRSGLPLADPIPVMSAEDHGTFSPGGDQFLTASGDGKARLWEVSTGKLMGKPMHHQGLNSAEFSPDGLHILTRSGSPLGTNHTVQMWNFATHEAIGPTLPDNSDLGFSVCAHFSTDGRFLLIPRSWGKLELWNTASGKLHHALSQDEHDIVTDAEFSPDGNRVVICQSGTAQLWDVATGMPIGRPMKHEDTLESAHFSSDGLRIMTVGITKKMMRTWDAFSGEQLGLETPQPLPSREKTASNGLEEGLLWDSAPSEVDVDGSDLTFLAGRAINANGQPTDIAQEQRVAWKKKLSASNSTSAWRKLLHWKLSDPNARTVTYRSRTTAPEHIEREVTFAMCHFGRFRRDENLENPAIDNSELTALLNLDPCFPLTHVALAAIEENKATQQFLKNYGLKRLAIWEQSPEGKLVPAWAPGPGHLRAKVAIILWLQSDQQRAKEVFAELIVKHDPQKETWATAAWIQKLPDFEWPKDFRDTLQELAK